MQARAGGPARCGHPCAGSTRDFQRSLTWGLDIPRAGGSIRCFEFPPGRPETLYINAARSRIADAEMTQANLHPATVGPFYRQQAAQSFSPRFSIGGAQGYPIKAS